MEKVKGIYFATKGFIVNEDKFLVVHKKQEEENVWELPGGRMEFGETAQMTFKRELFEETGLQVEPIKVLDTWNFVNKDYQITGIIFMSRTEDKVIKLSDEHDKYKWVELKEESVELLHPVFKECMKGWDWSGVTNENIK